LEKKYWIALLIVILIATGSDYLILKDRYLRPQTVQNFSLSSSRDALVEGQDREAVVTSASGDGYYRVSSGAYSLEGEHITGDVFQSKDTFPLGMWVVEDGTEISITVQSATPVEVTLVSTADNFELVIFLTALLSVMIFFMVWAILM